MVSEHAVKVLVASNRGPVSYTPREDGSLDSKRGGAGSSPG
ncbi:trehalose 6-phosphate synthase [Streptomyces sp. PalvLS-984]|nr:trehalose 6-phosphate synthase [Streptomyces sp. PalvLS-984]